MEVVGPETLRNLLGAEQWISSSLTMELSNYVTNMCLWINFWKILEVKYLSSLTVVFYVTDLPEVESLIVVSVRKHILLHCVRMCNCFHIPRQAISMLIPVFAYLLYVRKVFFFFFPKFQAWCLLRSVLFFGNHHHWQNSPFGAIAFLTRFC
jgi:hypothetical protein